MKKPMQNVTLTSDHRCVLVVKASIKQSVFRRGRVTALQTPAEAIKNRGMYRTKIFTILIGVLLAALPVLGQENVEQIIAQKVQPILPENGKGGGVAVAVRMN
jgi:hypothetical protein